MPENIHRVPGVYPGDEQEPKQILASTVGLLKRGVTLLANMPDVLPGDVLGQVTESEKYRRRTYTTLSEAAAIDDTHIHASDAGPFVAGDELLIEAETVTIQSVDYVNNVINLTGALTADHAQGVAVKGKDGSEVARCISLDRRDTDTIDQLVSVAYGGAFLSSELRGLDSTAITELGGKSFADVGVLKF